MPYTCRQLKILLRLCIIALGSTFCTVGSPQVDRAKVLSNTIKQKRKEKAGKWEVPLPKVRSRRQHGTLHSMYLCISFQLELISIINAVLRSSSAAQPQQ
jgi:hypothetical protein